MADQTNSTPPRDDAPMPCPFCDSPAAYYGASVRCTSFSCNSSMSPRWTKDVVGSAQGDADTRLALAKADTTLRWNTRRADQPARVGVDIRAAGQSIADMVHEWYGTGTKDIVPAALIRRRLKRFAALLPTEAKPLGREFWLETGRVFSSYEQAMLGAGTTRDPIEIIHVREVVASTPPAAPTDKKRSCPRHSFDVPEQRQFGQKFACKLCGAEMRLNEIGTYIQGYEAAGGNADDIVPCYRGQS